MLVSIGPLHFYYTWTIFGGRRPFPFVYRFGIRPSLLTVHAACCYALVGQNVVLSSLFVISVTDTLLMPGRASVRQAPILKYRTMCVMYTIFNDSYGLSFAPTMKYMLSLVVMIWAAGTIWLTDEGVRFGPMSVPHYLTRMLIVGVNTGCNLWTESKGFIRRVRYSEPDQDAPPMGSRTYMKRVAESLRPIWFGVAGLYYIERSRSSTSC